MVDKTFPPTLILKDPWETIGETKNEILKIKKPFEMAVKVFNDVNELILEVGSLLDNLSDHLEIQPWWEENMPNQVSADKSEVLDAFKNLCQNDTTWAESNHLPWQFNLEEANSSIIRLNFQFGKGIQTGVVQLLMIKNEDGYLFMHHE